MSNTFDHRVAGLVTLFETLRPDDVARLGDYYTADVYFKDPFNEFNGLAGVQQVFRHMFSALIDPRFKVYSVMVQGDQCFLTWHFRFRFQTGEAEQTIRGASHLHLNVDGKIISHRDYWDAAEELYEKLPVLGSLMRWLKRRAQGPAPAAGQG
jgi:ketosteroid isomerase-like protein